MSAQLTTGIHQITGDKYHSDPCEVPSLSNSLSQIIINKTMLHAWLAHPRLNPDYVAPDAAIRMDIGTSAHALLLEGLDSIVVCNFDDWRKKEAQLRREDARAAGKIPLLAYQYASVLAMAETAKLAATRAGISLASGKPEQTLMWTDGETHCRSRLDWLADDHDLIVDYKTTDLPNPAAFMRAMAGNGYDMQSAFYPRGLKAITGQRADFLFMVQEVKAPYLCYFVRPSATMQEIGRIKIERALTLWSACMKSGIWPGYPAEIMEAESTSWQLGEAENMAAELEYAGKIELFDKDAPGAKENFLFGKVSEKMEV